jgi:excisionase family DNA binding protein
MAPVPQRRAIPRWFGALVVRSVRWSGRQDSNLRPLGPEGPNADPHGLVPGHLASYPFDNTWVEGDAGSHTVAPLPPVATPFGALVVHDAVGRLLTVREVAARLRVSRATVYRLVRAGALPVLRVSNAIRIPAAALARGALPEKLAMRAQSDELEGLRVGLPVDEQEVRP